MHHDDRNVAIAILRNLVLHVHLVNGDIAAAESTAAPGRRVGGRRGRLRQGFGLPADEEAPLFLEDERLGLFLCHRGANQENREYPETNFHASESYQKSVTEISFREAWCR